MQTKILETYQEYTTQEDDIKFSQIMVHVVTMCVICDTCTVLQNRAQCLSCMYMYVLEWKPLGLVMGGGRGRDCKNAKYSIVSKVYLYKSSFL